MDCVDDLSDIRPLAPVPVQHDPEAHDGSVHGRQRNQWPRGLRINSAPALCEIMFQNGLDKSIGQFGAALGRWLDGRFC